MIHVALRHPERYRPTTSRRAANIRRHAQAMVNDLGEAIKPYLKQLYMAVKHDPRATDLRKSMDKEDHDDEHDVTG